MLAFQNKDISFLRKPNQLPSTSGSQDSFLDMFSKPQELKDLLQNNPYFDLCKPYIDLSDKQEIKDFDTRLAHQTTTFSLEQEYGLLNRLDNDTGGFLYFAKTPEIYASYKELQQQNKLQKQYLAHVQGNPFYKTAEQSMVIDFPIMHHAQDDRKMVVIKSFADTQKGRGEQHNVTTAIKLIEYNPETNISTLLVTITKGIRHQIRCHLASIGCAIIGDKLYNKKSQDPILHLWSLGFKVSDSD